MTTEDVRHTDRGGRTPLHYAAVERRIDDVKRLIAAGAEVDARENTGNWTPLMFAAQMDSNIDVIEALVGAGADVDLVNEKGETALYIATKSPGNGPGGAQMIRYLLDHGADAHIPANDGATAIDFVKRADDTCGRRAAFGDLLDG